MNNQSIIKKIKQFEALHELQGKTLQAIVKELGEGITPPPASKGLSPEDRLKARMKRDRVIAKRIKR